MRDQRSKMATLGQEHPHSTHSPEGWETADSWTGRAGILGVALAWAWGGVVGAGQLWLGPLGTLGAWGSGHYVCW